MRKLAYSIREVCELTSASRTSIYAEIKAGRLIARKLGRRTIVAQCDLDTWISNCPAVGEAGKTHGNQ